MAEYIVRTKPSITTCRVCPFAIHTPFGTACPIRWGSEKRYGTCPLVELPENHGRIVDLDRVLDWLANDKRCFSMAMTSKIKKALSDAPTILEASNKTETPRKACICPHYQGVCGLDEDIVCYCSSSYEKCEKYKENEE